MSACNTNRQYLNLSATPARMSRDGHAGRTAKMYVPFYGWYFFSGQKYVPNNGTLPQSKQRFLGGIDKPCHFEKYPSCGC